MPIPQRTQFVLETVGYLVVGYEFLKTAIEDDERGYFSALVDGDQIMAKIIGPATLEDYIRQRRLFYPADQPEKYSHYAAFRKVVAE
jgi:hypothetical protein